MESNVQFWKKNDRNFHKRMMAELGIIEYGNIHSKDQKPADHMVYEQFKETLPRSNQ